VVVAAERERKEKERDTRFFEQIKEKKKMKKQNQIGVGEYTTRYMY
jgi:hypothetical protein